MNKDEINDLMMGAALVALAYAMYTHFKPAAAAPTMVPQPGMYGANGPASIISGEPSPASVSPFTSLADLLNGTVHDIGSFQGRDYLNEMADPILNGNNGQDSIVKPGGYW